MNRFVVCLHNQGYEASLEVRKLYETLVDTDAEKHGQLRVIDESGEDYIYPASAFADITLPKNLAAQVFHSLA